MNDLLINLEDVYYDFQPLLLPFLQFIAVIIFGTISTLIAARMIRKLLHGLKADERLAQLLPKEAGAQPMKIEEPASHLVVIVGMLLVALWAFKSLPFDFVSSSLDRAFLEVGKYAPLIGAAGVLLVVGAVLANLLKMVVQKFLEVTRLDRRLRENISDDKNQLSVSKPLAEVAYWAVMVIFMLQILKTLKLESILEPFESMLRKFFEYIPNLVAATLILMAGWYIVRFAKIVVSSSLNALGSDRLGEKTGLNKIFGERFLSRTGGWLVYGLAMIAVVVASLNTLQLSDVTSPLVAMLQELLSFVPILLGGCVVVTLTFAVAKFLSNLSKGALENAGFDSLVDRLGLWRKIAGSEDSASLLASKLVFLAVLVLGSIQALEVFHFSGLAILLSTFVEFAGNVLLGLLILAVGFYIADWAQRLVRASKVQQKEFLATLAKVSVWVMAGIMALDKMKMANTTINIAFGIILGGLALAAALAFGLGGQSLAQNLLKKWDNELKTSTPRVNASSPKKKKKSSQR